MRPRELPVYAMRAAWVFYTVVLALRWLAWKGHPPWVSLYETLLFFGWAVLSAQLFFDLRHRARGAEFPVAVLVLVTIVTGWMSATKGIQPLPPTLRHFLVFIHPPLGFLSYGAFAVSAAFSVTLLLRDRVRPEVLLFGLSALVVGIVPFAGGKDFYGSPTAFLFGWAAFGLFSVHLFLSALGLLFEIPGPARPAGPLGAAGESITMFQLVARIVFLLAFGCLGVAALALIPIVRAGRGGILFGASALFALTAFSLLVLLALRFRASLESWLPPVASLDRWSYEATRLAFAGLGFCLIFGMAWAFLAWGRLWSWDLKEVWTLGLWLCAAIQLHWRQLLRPTARSMAVLSCAAFVVGLFCYLGLNVVLSGMTLHAFGAN